MATKAKLIVKNVSKIDGKTILEVDSITNGLIKLYGIYNLADKFNIRIINFKPVSSNIFSHPIINLHLEIQLVNDYKKINIGDILTPLD
jgi:hypothetical protein